MMRRQAFCAVRGILFSLRTETVRAGFFTMCLGEQLDVTITQAENHLILLSRNAMKLPWDLPFVLEQWSPNCMLRIPIQGQKAR